jgi:hypothetical protein
MKKAFLIIAVSTTTYFCLNFKQTTNYKEGDIIFQTTSGEQGKPYN